MRHIINEQLKGIDDMNAFIGKEITEAKLIGRNYYHYSYGEKDENQPFDLDLSELGLDFEEEDSEYDEEYSEYLPVECWVKRISAVEDGYEAYYHIVLFLDEAQRIKEISVIQEEVQRMGGGMLFIPGMELPYTSFYDELDYPPDEIINELELLTKGRALPKKASFIGKRLPQRMIDDGGNGGSITDYVFALQSAYRLAYMSVSVETTEEGVIQGFNYETYQSTGSSYGDMFSRPQLYNDHKNEAIDVLLYIIDQYSDDEYKRYYSKTETE